MTTGALLRLVLVVSALFANGAAHAAAAGRPVLGPGAIAASVRDPKGRPLAGAIIVADGPTLRRAITGSAGIATLQALPVGVYDVRVTRAGYEPFAKQVAIALGGTVPTILDVRIALASFANVRDAAAVIATPAVGTGGDPLVAHALTALPGVDILPLPRGAGSAPTLAGASAGETRIELDGIPIAGGPASFAALRFRNALVLDDVELGEPPALTTSTVRNAVGGILNYRTPAIEAGAAGGFELGQDSEFGAFQHARFTRTFGKLGILTDVVTGSGENRSQTLKTRYAFSNATSLGFASYGSQSSAPSAGFTVTNVAPVYAVDLRTSLGSGTLTARRFESAARTSSAPFDLPSLREDARVTGVQLGYDIPLNQSLVSIGFDRRSEVRLPLAAPVERTTFTAMTLRGNLQLSRTSRLELGDAYSGGTLLRPRHDPQVALALSPAERVTVRLAAGAAYATPDSGVYAAAASAAALAPESSFAYRLSVDAALGSEDHAWLSAFSLRRYDALAQLAQARALGVQIGIERAAAAGGFGGVAALNLVRSTAFGAEQPALRATGSSSVVAGSQLGSVPYSQARFALTYRADATELRIGTTLLGGNSAFGTRAVALGDAALTFPFAHVLRLRVGLQNVFGAAVADPALRPFYAPRELTLVAGAGFAK